MFTARAFAIVATAALLVAGLTGCRQNYDAASNWIGGQPGVESVSDLGNVTPIIPLGYEGTIRAHLESGLSDDRVVELADDATEYLREHDTGYSLHFELADGDFIFLVDRTGAANRYYLDSLRAYATDRVVTGAYVSDAYTKLIAGRRELVDLYFRYYDERINLVVQDADHEATASVGESGTPQCEEVGQERFSRFVDDLLDGTDLQLTVGPCTQISASTTRDDFVEAAFALRDRWEDAGSQDGFNLTLSSDTTQTGASFDHYGDELEVELTGPSDELLEFVRIVDADAFGDAELYLARGGAHLSDSDRTVCEILDLVRDQRGFDAIENLRLAQHIPGTDPEDDVEVSGPRALVVAYVDAETPASGPGDCTAKGSYEIQG